MKRSGSKKNLVPVSDQMQNADNLELVNGDAYIRQGHSRGTITSDKGNKGSNDASLSDMCWN